MGGVAKKVSKFSGSQQSSSGIHWIGFMNLIPKCQVEVYILNTGGDALIRVTNFHDNTLAV
jgi:hypothetical protein